MSDPRRGYVPEDDKEFSDESCKLLQKAQKDIFYLLEQGYPIKNASVFVGNHYMLSERQRLAVVRATADLNAIRSRKAKLLTTINPGSTIFLDGLNVIIVMEVALSKGTLIRGMDGTIRDLAGLRGTYRLIDVTDKAILLIAEKLEQLRIREAIIYLDAPVSNTGRLKQRIGELLRNFPFEVTVELTDNPDVILEQLGPVITSDAIILNRCVSWYNLVPEILSEKLPDVRIIELGN